MIDNIVNQSITAIDKKDRNGPVYMHGGPLLLNDGADVVAIADGAIARLAQIYPWLIFRNEYFHSEEYGKMALYILIDKDE